MTQLGNAGTQLTRGQCQGKINDVLCPSTGLSKWICDVAPKIGGENTQRALNIASSFRRIVAGDGFDGGIGAVEVCRGQQQADVLDLESEVDDLETIIRPLLDTSEAASMDGYHSEAFLVIDAVGYETKSGGGGGK